MLSVIILNVVMLSVIMLNVVAPRRILLTWSNLIVYKFYSLLLFLNSTCKLSALSPSIRLGCKDLPGTNTLSIMPGCGSDEEKSF